MLFSLTAKRFGDLLLIAVSLITVLKLLFRRPKEFYLSSVDFLVLSLLVIMAIAARQPALQTFRIEGPLVRAILLVVAVRLLALRGPVLRRYLVLAALAALALFALAGLR